MNADALNVALELLDPEEEAFLYIRGGRRAVRIAWIHRWWEVYVAPPQNDVYAVYRNYLDTKYPEPQPQHLDYWDT